MKNKLKPPKNLQDHYGQDLEIGDVVLGAVAGGKFHKTQFKHSLIVGRTDFMICLHQLGMRDDVERIKETLRDRGKQGGRINPAEVIRVSQGILPARVITDLIAKGTRQLPVHPIPNPSYPWNSRTTQAPNLAPSAPISLLLNP